MSAGEREHRGAAWIAPMMPALLGGGIVVLFAVAYFHGRDARARAERAEAILVKGENDAFCAGLGLAPQTGAYGLCMHGLTGIRRRQDERRNEDAIGKFQD